MKAKLLLGPVGGVVIGTVVIGFAPAVSGPQRGGQGQREALPHQAEARASGSTSAEVGVKPFAVLTVREDGSYEVRPYDQTSASGTPSPQRSDVVQSIHLTDYYAHSAARASHSHQHVLPVDPQGEPRSVVGELSLKSIDPVEEPLAAPGDVRPLRSSDPILEPSVPGPECRLHSIDPMKEPPVLGGEAVLPLRAVDPMECLDVGVQEPALPNRLFPGVIQGKAQTSTHAELPHTERGPGDEPAGRLLPNSTPAPAPAVRRHEVPTAQPGVTGPAGGRAQLDPRGCSWQTIFSDGFEGAWYWTTYGSPTWRDTSYRACNGSWSAWCAEDGLNAPGPYAPNMNAWMVYGPFDLSDAVDARVTFDFWLDSEPGYDEFFWGASGDGTNFGGYVRSSRDQSCSSRTFSLSSHLGDPTVWFAFNFASDSSVQYEGVYVDDVVIEKCVGQAAEPDLVCTCSASCDSSTGLLDVSVEVCNIDTGDAGAYEVGIYASTNDIISPSDYRIGYGTSSGLPGGQCQTFSGSLPASVPQGTYYIGAYADDEFQVAESSETNNTCVDGQEKLPCPVVQPPDLVCTCSASCNSSTGLLDVSVEVCNINTDNAGAYEVGIYASTNDIISTSDYRIGYGTSSGLPGGQCQTFSGSLPASVPQGTYYIGAYADDQFQVAEKNETNNTCVDGQEKLPCPVVQPPDLVCTCSASCNPSTCLLDVIVEVCNINTDDAGAYEVGIYASTNDIISTSDYRIGYGTSGGLPGGQCQTFSGSLTASGIPPDTYYIGAYADDQFQVAEKNETNNTCLDGQQVDLPCCDGHPDLAVPTCSAACNSSTGLLDVSVEVCNINTDNAGAYEVGIYASTNDIISTSDYRIGYGASGGLPGGQCQTFSGSLPASVPQGTYYIGAYADDQFQVVEKNETNNTCVDGQEKLPCPGGEPDIRVDPTSLVIDCTSRSASMDGGSSGGSGKTVAVKPLDLSDPQANLGEILPDQIIIRFKTAQAAALHADRMTVAPGDAAAWLNNAVSAGMAPLPGQVLGLRPYVSGHAKALRKLKEVPQLAADAAAVEAGQPLPANKVPAVAAALAAASEPFGPLDMFYARLAPATDVRAMCLELMKRADVVYANPSPVSRIVTVPNDPLYTRQWNLARISMPTAWDNSGNTLGTARVCVIDTGVRISHDELAGRTADPVDVYLDNGDAYGDGDPDNDDEHGHGTACAGIIGAIRDNSLLVAGIAPVTIIPVNAYAQGGIANYEDGVYWGVDHAADVINMSFGRHDGPFQSEIDAANYAQAYGVVVCAAAGNDDVSADNHYPSAIPYYISVGAVDDDDIRVRQPTWWWGSNYGDTVDICAPGQGDVGAWGDSILTLWRDSNNDWTNNFNGTSAAAPHVSALAGLLKHINGSLTGGQIRACIESTAEDQVGDPAEDTPGWDQYHGHGLIDAAAAADCANAGGGDCLWIYNVGGGKLQVTSIDTPWWATVSPAPPFSIQPGGSQQVCVQVDCGACDCSDLFGDLVIHSNDPDEPTVPVSLHVICPGGPPDVNCEDLQDRNFGSVTVGQCSSTYTWTVTNTGCETLSGTIKITGADPTQFECTSGCGSFSLAQGQSRTVSVRFCPTSCGSKNATLRINSNDPDENPCDIGLTGTGTSPPDINCEDQPGSLPFGSVLLGDCSQTQSVTITNEGCATLSGTIKITGADPSEFDCTGCGSFSLPQGQSRTVSVRFCPTSAGGKTAMLCFNTNDPDEPTCCVNLAGTGVPPDAPDLVIDRICFNDGTQETCVRHGESLWLDGNVTYAICVYVKNVGGGDAPSTHAVASWNDDPNDCNVLPIQHFIVSGVIPPLTPGQEYCLANDSYTFGYGFTGRHALVARADRDNEAPEGDTGGEDNNDFCATIDVKSCPNGSCDPGEDQCNCPEDCGQPPATETDCTDGVDNDCDHLTDCDDPDCSGDPGCLDFTYRCVILEQPSTGDRMAQLPQGVDKVNVGQTIYVEFWAQDSGAVNTGVVSAYADLDYPEGCVDPNGVVITCSPLFNLFCTGTNTGSIIDELGGSQLAGGVGVDEWARVAYVQFEATAGCEPAEFCLQPATTESSAFGRGKVQPSDIDYSCCSVAINECCCIYDLDDNCGVGGGDLGWFAPCWGCCDGDPCWTEHNCVNKDFDCNGCVGGGDLGWFAGAWGRTCDQLDPMTEFPPCRQCEGEIICPWGGKCPAPGLIRGMPVANEDNLVKLALRLARAPHPTGALDQLVGTRLGIIGAGEHVFAEVWVTDATPSSRGLTAVFADIAYDASQFAVVGVDPGEVFTLFTGAMIDQKAGVVRGVGGATMEPDHGVGQWTRVATVEFKALVEVRSPIVAVSPIEGEAVSGRGRGLIPNDRIRVVQPDARQAEARR